MRGWPLSPAPLRTRVSLPGRASRELGSLPEAALPVWVHLFGSRPCLSWCQVHRQECDLAITDSVCGTVRSDCAAISRVAGIKQKPDAAWNSPLSSSRGPGNSVPCILTEFSPYKAMKPLRPGELGENTSSLKTSSEYSQLAFLIMQTLQRRYSFGERKRESAF